MKAEKEIKKELNQIEKDIRSIQKQMKSRSFLSLSRYSQNLIQEELDNLTTRQFEIIEQMIIKNHENKN